MNGAAWGVVQCILRASIGSSPGLGTDAWLAGKGVSGAGLVHEGAVVHRSLFPEEESATGAPSWLVTETHAPGRRRPRGGAVPGGYASGWRRAAAGQG
jgi:hypothetical protein